MLIIPAIDLLDGKCVRLYQGEYEKASVYSLDPVEQAQIFEQMGVKRLHIVDLNGAKEGKPINSAVIEKISKKTNLFIQVGGGIRTIETAERYLEKGVSKVILGSILAKNPDLTLEFIQKIGDRFLIGGIDFKDNYFLTDGWLSKSELTPLNLAKKMLDFGLKEFIFTDISKDGTLSGPNIAFYQTAVETLKGALVIASGGVGSNEDIMRLNQIKDLFGVIVGKAFYEKKIDLKKFDY